MFTLNYVICKNVFNWWRSLDSVTVSVTRTQIKKNSELRLNLTTIITMIIQIQYIKYGLFLDYAVYFKNNTALNYFKFIYIYPFIKSIKLQSINKKGFH